jgi:histidinol-phosphate aminotransferase
MAPIGRADLAGLPDYVAGRKIPGAIVLSSNEVPYDPPVSVIAAICEAARGVNRYPDMGSGALTRHLAAALDMDQDMVAVGCGSVALCQQFVQALCASGDEVIFGWRSFEAYPIVTRVGGARSIPVPLTSGFANDLDAIAAAVTGSTRLVFISNPNNPTGTALGRAAVERFLDSLRDDVVVVLDEAYQEFVTDPDIPDGLTLLDGRLNLAVLRTFSKAYRLAGIRVGYCVASPPLARLVRKVGVPFSVNALAEAAAIASLEASAELLAHCRAISRERERVRDALVDAGYQVPGSQANFVWLPLRERTAQFASHCLQQKIVVRPFADDGVRVTIGTPGENDAFLTAARSFDR